MPPIELQIQQVLVGLDFVDVHCKGYLLAGVLWQHRLELLAFGSLVF